MDIALHPDFATNGYVYLSYSKPISADDTAVAIARGRWDGRALRDTRDVFVAGAETTGGARWRSAATECCTCRPEAAASRTRRIPPVTAARCCD